MKEFILLGDVHLRLSNPISRIDSFPLTQQKKLEKVFSIADEIGADIICTGDLFDRPDPSYSLLFKYLSLFKSFKGKFYVVPGNHDIYGANLTTLSRSALGVFAASGAVEILSHYPTTLDGVNICGTSYMHEGKAERVPGKHNILVIHDMILNKKEWKEQENFIYADEYLNNNSGWDTIVCGHYHYRFSVSDKDRIIVNPGAMVRVKATIGDMSLEPGVYHYDRHDLKLISLNAAPSSNVFFPKFKGVDNQQNGNQEMLSEFVESLLSNKEQPISNLSSIIMEQLNKVGCSQDVCDLVKELVAKSEEEKNKVRNKE